MVFLQEYILVVGRISSVSFPYTCIRPHPLVTRRMTLTYPNVIGDL